MRSVMEARDPRPRLDPHRRAQDGLVAIVLEVATRIAQIRGRTRGVTHP